MLETRGNQPSNFQILFWKSSWKEKKVFIFFWSLTINSHFVHHSKNVFIEREINSKVASGIELAYYNIPSKLLSKEKESYDTVAG